MGGSNITIAKNTVYLYARMIITLGVSLFTSRVILRELGIEDYGVYGVIISIIAIWTSLTGCVGQSVSRFITYQLGKKNAEGREELNKCVATSKAIMITLAGCVFVICQTLGLWLLFKNSGIPANRLNASFWAFQLCVLASIISLVQISYTAIIIAHERMKIYAYASIVETVVKLLIVYLLVWSPFDKLIFYALLLLAVQITQLLFYRYYCRTYFEEAKERTKFYRDYSKPILDFTGWSAMNVSSTTLLMQASNIILSNLFNPAVVAARSLGYQIKYQAANFTKNFRVAANPQIIKRYSEGNIDGYKTLLFQSTDVSFYLMLAIVVPLLLETDKLLSVWLVTVPEYAVAFVRLALVEALFAIYDMSYYLIFESTGKLKENSIACTICDVVGFIIIVICYMMGSSPLTISWGIIVLTIFEGMIIKPALAVKQFNFSYKEFLIIYRKGALLITASLLPSLIIKYILGNGTIWSTLMIVFMSFICCLIAIYSIGFDKKQRMIIKQYIFNTIKL